jgi:ATP-dependent RNA helicase DeaD
MDKKPFPELGLSPEMLKAVEALGFDQPSPVQAQAIPPALAGRDVVGQSQTGSGKTMAFAIPLVQGIDVKRRAVQGLVLCPTRELAMQVCEEMHKLAAHKKGVKAAPIYGGASYGRQLRALEDGAQIVVGTPGRVQDLVNRRALDLRGLKALVFDEADEMLDMGFREEIDELMRSVPPDRQTLFFSATLDGPVRELIRNYTRDPEHVRIEHKALTVPTIEQSYIELNSRSKLEALSRVLDLEAPRRAIIFANTKRTVDEVTDGLMARGYRVDRLHGDLNQTMRERVMRNFRDGRVEVLVATDVAARGLDVNDVELVVNFEPPYDEEDYVHRIGRTGRAGKSGRAVSLVSGREIYLLQRIMRYARVAITRKTVPTREDLDGRRADAYFEKVRGTLDSGQFRSHEATVQRLLDAGFSSTDIASALLDLWMREDASEREEIFEDRPKAQRTGPGPSTGAGTGSGPSAAAGKSGAGGEFVRLFINVGEMDGIGPGDIAGAIYRTAELPAGTVGRIEIFERCSFVAVPREHADLVIERMAQTSWRGRQMRMNLADRQEESAAPPRRPSGGKRPDHRGDRSGRPAPYRKGGKQRRGE